ncbi:hypothetical protein ACS0TY_003511 [Phlomoides rotata]
MFSKMRLLQILGRLFFLFVLYVTLRPHRSVHLLSGSRQSTPKKMAPPPDPLSYMPPPPINRMETKRKNVGVDGSLKKFFSAGNLVNISLSKSFEYDYGG